MLNPDWTFLISIAIFITALFFISKFLVNPLLSVVLYFDRETANNLKKAEEYRHKTNEIRKNIENVLTADRDKAFREARIIIRKAQDDADKIITAAQLYAKEKLERERERINREKQEYIEKYVQSVSEQIAGYIAETILKRKIN